MKQNTLNENRFGWGWHNGDLNRDGRSHLGTAMSALLGRIERFTATE